MVSTKHPGSVVSTRKRPRKRYDPARRREVAKTRELGACTDCRSRKVRCHHAQELPKGGISGLPEFLSPTSSPQLKTVAYPTLKNRAAREDCSRTHGDLRGRTPPLDSQLWDDGIMPFYDVENYASQSPMIATTKGLAVAASSPPAASFQHVEHNETSSRYITQAMHESSYSASLSYLSSHNLVGLPDAWDMSPSLYSDSCQMSRSQYPPHVPELDGSEADRALDALVNAYPQYVGQGYEYHQATTLCPIVHFNNNTSPNAFHTGGESDIVSAVTVLSSGDTIDNSDRDPRA